MERTFYSLSPGLICWAGKDGGVHQTMLNGSLQIVTDAPIRFTEIGKGPDGHRFGVYTTSNPEHIEYLDDRVKNIGDVILPDEYNRRITPDTLRISMMESKIRELEEKNSLLEALKAQGKLPIK